MLLWRPEHASIKTNVGVNTKSNAAVRSTSPLFVCSTRTPRGGGEGGEGGEKMGGKREEESESERERGRERED